MSLVPSCWSSGPSRGVGRKCPFPGPTQSPGGRTPGGGAQGSEFSQASQVIICKLRFENHCHKKKRRTGAGRRRARGHRARLLFCMPANPFCPRVPCTRSSSVNKLQTADSPSAGPSPRPGEKNILTFSPGWHTTMLICRNGTFPTEWAHSLKMEATAARDGATGKDRNRAVTPTVCCDLLHLWFVMDDGFQQGPVSAHPEEGGCLTVSRYSKRLHLCSCAHPPPQTLRMQVYLSFCHG